jgi:hypothetical protein
MPRSLAFGPRMKELRAVALPYRQSRTMAGWRRSPAIHRTRTRSHVANVYVEADGERLAALAEALKEGLLFGAFMEPRGCGLIGLAEQVG